MRQRAWVLVGTGRYEDAWHDLPATAYRVARELTALEIDVDVRGTRPGTLVALGTDGPDLVVVMASVGRPDPEHDGTDADWAPGHRALAEHVRTGGSLLGLHAAAMTFRDSPAWDHLLGGRWVEGRSWHPPIERWTVEPDETHPVTAGLKPFELYDERYTDLEVADGVQPLVWFAADGLRQPVAWAREGVPEVGRGRVVYDALGHGVESYESHGRRGLLARELRWLLRRG